MSVLSIRDLAVCYGRQEVLHGVSFDVERGECLGIVGESGCGKSTLALAAMRCLPRGGRITGGRIVLNGAVINAWSRAEMREPWRREISMVYQDPSRALNPTLRIDAQMAESFALLGIPLQDIPRRAEAALAQVRIADPARVLGAYPHELSGGMQQRVVIAMALAKDPSLLVLDEPTTGLDATVEAAILDVVDTLRRQAGTAVLLISHNLRVIARMADRTAILYAGVLVEQGPAASVLREPRHPYTIRLLHCLPGTARTKRDGDLPTIPGQLPPQNGLPPGCIFAPRCQAVQPVCATMPRPRGAPDHRALCHFDPPFAQDAAPAPASLSGRHYRRIVLRAINLGKTYHRRGGAVRALAPLSLSVKEGETLGIVGESGSGKTTLARLLLGLASPDRGGTLLLDGNVLPPLLRGRSGQDRKALQIVFQNPDSALNRSRQVRAILAEPLRRLARLRGDALLARLTSLTEGVRLGPALLSRRPRSLSGGQKQRVAIARAFAGEPRLVVCDEPTSALDVSVQAAVLNVLNDLQRRVGTAYVFISHDLDVVRYMADRIAVLYRGTLVEIGPVKEVLVGPQHPYTSALLAATALPDGAGEGGGGCIFRHRCPLKLGPVCDDEEPRLDGDDHAIRCHIPREQLRKRAPI